MRSVLKFRIGVSYLGDVRNVLRFWQDVVWSERLYAVSPFVVVKSVRFEALPRLLNLIMDLGVVGVCCTHGCVSRRIVRDAGAAQGWQEATMSEDIELLRNKFPLRDDTALSMPSHPKLLIGRWARSRISLSSSASGVASL